MGDLEGPPDIEDAIPDGAEVFGVDDGANDTDHTDLLENCHGALFHWSLLQSNLQVH